MLLSLRSTDFLWYCCGTVLYLDYLAKPLPEALCYCSIVLVWQVLQWCGCHQQSVCVCVSVCVRVCAVLLHGGSVSPRILGFGRGGAGHVKTCHAMTQLSS